MNQRLEEMIQKIHQIILKLTIVLNLKIPTTILGIRLGLVSQLHQEM